MLLFGFHVHVGPSVQGCWSWIWRYYGSATSVYRVKPPYQVTTHEPCIHQLSLLSLCKNSPINNSHSLPTLRQTSLKRLQLWFVLSGEATSWSREKTGRKTRRWEKTVETGSSCSLGREARKTASSTTTRNQNEDGQGGKLLYNEAESPPMSSVWLGKMELKTSDLYFNIVGH